jgi:hypothetical protein
MHPIELDAKLWRDRHRSKYAAPTLFQTFDDHHA